MGISRGCGIIIRGTEIQQAMDPEINQFSYRKFKYGYCGFQLTRNICSPKESQIVL
jgi:hypothetical protein